MTKGTPIKVPKIKLTYKGVFDLNAVYLLMFQFLSNEDWKSKSNPQGVDYEVYYLEKGDDRTSYIVKWQAEKVYNKYLKFYLDMTINGRNISKTELLQDGKKITADQGEFVLELQGSYETDYTGDWEKHFLLKHFVKYHEKKLAEDLREGGEPNLANPLYNDLFDLYELVKGHLKLRGGEYEFEPISKRPG